jgi:hypothetical protein
MILLAQFIAAASVVLVGSIITFGLLWSLRK